MVVRLLVAGLLLAEGARAASLVKRSDDPNTLTPVVQQLSAQLAELSARLDVVQDKQTVDEGRLASLGRHVAFNAQFSADALDAPASGPYTFDTVIFNDGNAYDPTHGVFTAPYDGVYVFATQVFTNGAERPVTDIIVNGNIASRMALDADSTGDESYGETRQSSMTSVNVRLSTGDRVWVKNGYTQSMAVHGQHHTFFTGALLYAD